MPAITKKEELTENFLNSLKRKDLLTLCKEFGIKCVGKNSELIDKLLEHKTTANISSTPHNTANSEDVIKFNATRTPQKKLIDISLPVVTTPSSALIKSIVQSARKTGLNSSPVRVPFALSPMAAKLQESRINFSPVKTTVAKEPSLPIKEAFLTNEDMELLEREDANEELYCLPFDNKRKHEIETETGDFDENSHHDKREKLDESETEESVNVFDTSAEVEQYIVTDKIESSNNNDDDQPLNSFSDDSNILEPEESATAFSPSDFSTDLLTNLKDPEFTSPELVSAIDARVSRSEHQDQRVIIERDDNINERVSGTYDNNASYNKSNHTNTNPLLPSGIIKLLEKRRQEKESTHSKDHRDSKDPKDPMTHTASNSNPTRKKFDLKESLKRPLNYKPHIGSLKPKKEF